MKLISATAQDICNPVSHKVSCVSIVQKNHDSDTHFCGPNDTIFDTTGLSWQPYNESVGIPRVLIKQIITRCVHSQGILIGG